MATRRRDPDRWLLRYRTWAYSHAIREFSGSRAYYPIRRRFIAPRVWIPWTGINCHRKSGSLFWERCSGRYRYICKNSYFWKKPPGHFRRLSWSKSSRYIFVHDCGPSSVFKRFQGLDGLMAPAVVCSCKISRPDKKDIQWILFMCSVLNHRKLPNFQ